MGDPRVILTPHTAAYDPQALAARYRTTAEVVQHLASADPAGITPYLAES
jgi:phosphoglycerate dehydrogenase-like enzyme